MNRIYGNGQFIKLTAVDGVSNLWQWTAYQINGSGCCIKLTAVTLPGYTTIQYTMYFNHLVNILLHMINVSRDVTLKLLN